MDFKELINKRYSVRSYEAKEIEDEKLHAVLSAANIAPSAVNFQPWAFIVIREKENLDKIKASYKRDWIKEAPCIIVACGDHSKAWHRKQDNKDHTDIDVSIAIDHITLQATELGLGTCWVCNFDVEKCNEALNLPEHMEPIALIPIGYPADKLKEKKRKALEEIVYWEKY